MYISLGDWAEGLFKIVVHKYCHLHKRQNFRPNNNTYLLLVI